MHDYLFHEKLTYTFAKLPVVYGLKISIIVGVVLDDTTLKHYNQ